MLGHQGSEVFRKLKEAFSNKPNVEFQEKVVYFTFIFGPKARIYVAKKSREDIARLRATCTLNFPNGEELDLVLKRFRVPLSPVDSHPDYMIGKKDIDAVIEVLKKGIDQL